MTVLSMYSGHFVPFDRLIEWYQLNGRDLPWRQTKDPYKIWISEIILQQTRVAQGFEYYLQFIEKFPDVKTLAQAKEEEVLRLWQGLGYYSRARNIHASSKEIMSRLGGTFPNTYENILSLKGVGAYTAAAIASIAFGEHKAVIDGNVIRVLARLYAINKDLRQERERKKLQLFLDQIIRSYHPSSFNQAMMELGALICKPQNPTCEKCPLNSHCKAYETNQTDKLPIKIKKARQKTLYLYYVVVEDSNRLLAKQRSEKGIWQNMYDFPAIESPTKTPLKELEKQLKALLKADNIKLKKCQSVKHILTHRLLKIDFFRCESTVAGNFEKPLQWIQLQDWNRLPKPKVIDSFSRFLSENINE